MQKAATGSRRSQRNRASRINSCETSPLSLGFAPLTREHKQPPGAHDKFYGKIEKKHSARHAVDDQADLTRYTFAIFPGFKYPSCQRVLTRLVCFVVIDGAFWRQQIEERQPNADRQTPSEINERYHDGAQIGRNRAYVLKGQPAQISGIETGINDSVPPTCIKPHQQPCKFAP